MGAVKKAVFVLVMLTPLLSIVGGLVWLGMFSNLPQVLYATSIRNIYFDCIRFVPRAFVYTMNPGACELKNIEYATTLTHDTDGFRNGARRDDYRVAVIGDSHAHGVGVNDDEVFARLLESVYRHPTKNLAVGSYATMRELEALRQHGGDVDHVVLQYCDNDLNENEASVALSGDEFQGAVRKQWTALKASYDEGKAAGLKKPLLDLAALLRRGMFASKQTWRRQLARRPIEREAAAFAKVVQRYQDVLEGKQLVVLESSGFGLNSPRLAPAFRSALSAIGWLRHSVIDTSAILDSDDYYFLDDHLNAEGHRKLAAAVAREIELLRARP